MCGHLSPMYLVPYVPLLMLLGHLPDVHFPLPEITQGTAARANTTRVLPKLRDSE